MLVAARHLTLKTGDTMTTFDACSIIESGECCAQETR
jgi:hypothetical protein